MAEHGWDVVADERSLEGVDAVLTGTCLGEGLDKGWTRAAQARGIPVVSAIEHWSWFRERFILGEQLQLPDRILVNDERAHDAAVLAGLPKELLEVVGNPLLERLALDRGQRKPRQAYPKTGRTIVFVSEDLAADKHAGRLSGIKFTEHDLIQGLLTMRGPDDRIIVKMHPVEDPAKYEYLSGRVEVAVSATRETIADLADVVVGLGSMLLLELAILGCRVINVESIAGSEFVGSSLGATIAVSSIDELAHQLEEPLPTDPSFGDAFIGSGVRVGASVRRVIET
jgi:hypothetical protein